MHMSADEIEEEAVYQGSDHSSSLDEPEGDIPREQVNENEGKGEQQEDGSEVLHSRTIESNDLQGESELERFSPRQELLSLVDEEVAAARDEQEKRALQATKEEILRALDEAKGRRE